MIFTSQISLFQEGSRQSSLVDASQLRIARSAPSARDTAGDTELVVARQASYRYSASERTEFDSASRVSGEGGAVGVRTHTALAEKATELLVQGQQAVRISQAALGSASRGQMTGSVAVNASRYTFVSQSESRLLTASGSIELSDGESIDFTLSLRQEQARRYEYSESLRIEERPMTDPLVINFGATTAQLTDTLFEFDLTADGDGEQFARLDSGSGYLVLDSNGNGAVDDGSELFGPASGSGFAELARFDQDGNRWIDSNDAVFEQLKVWVQTSDQGEQLLSLAEVGVRALFVGSVEDRFTLTNSQGVPLGEIKSSGIYLTAGGEVRTLEEIDLAAQQERSDPVMEQRLDTRRSGGTASANEGTNGRLDARIESIREALDKLTDIRDKQKAFIEGNGEPADERLTLEDYLTRLDRLRLDLLKSQSDKREAANRYREMAGS